MQPYRIEQLAQSIHTNSPSEATTWENLDAPTQERYRETARTYAAVLLGGHPRIEVQHSVKTGNSVYPHQYAVPQMVVGNDVQVVRTKVVYPAAAFVTAWEENCTS
jgi:hypothetical protein